MRHNVREFVKMVTEHIDLPEPIIEIGSYQVEGQEELANLRPLFPGKRFTGCDMRPGNGVDRIENVECLSFQDESVGTIICMDTLEHVRNIISAKNEMHRVLKTNGYIIISSVMYHPIHDYPYDYWRFTPEAFSFLLNQYAYKKVFYQGFHDFPHTVLGIGAKTNNNNLEKISSNINNEPIYIYGNEYAKTYDINTWTSLKYRFLHKCLRELMKLALKLQYSVSNGV